MTAKLLIRGAQIVLVGDFAPATFAGDFLSRQSILSQVDLDEASRNYVHNEFTEITLSWLTFVCHPQRLEIEVRQEPLIRVKDIALSVLGILVEQPVSAVGLNSHTHYQLKDADSWHSFGDLIAPKQPWGRLAVDAAGNRRAGMRSLSLEFTRAEPAGKATLHVQPSLKVVPNGVYFGYNDHYEFPSDKQPSLAANAIEIIEGHWERSMQEAKDMAMQILEQVA